MQTFLAKYKVREGEMERLLAWAQKINTQRDEAIMTLQNEKVFVELAFLETFPDGDYLFYLMKCDDIDFVFKTLQKSVVPIDLFHKDQFPRAIHKSKMITPLIDLDLLESLK